MRRAWFVTLAAAWLLLAGVSVSEARNGWEALETAQASTPDLILTDLWMPVIDGLEAIQRLKSAPATAHVPVLVLSSQLDHPDASAVPGALCALATYLFNNAGQPGRITFAQSRAETLKIRCPCPAECV